MKAEGKRRSLRTLAAKLGARRTRSASKPKTQPQKVKPAPMKKQKKRNGSAATSSVTRSKSGPKKKNAKVPPKCVKCQAHPSTPRAYTKHLLRQHKSSLRANGVYLRCACGIKWTCDKNQKHNGNCDGRQFTLHKLEKKIGPKCFKCEAYPSSVWGYTKHLAKHHKTTLYENKKYLACACGIEIRSEHFVPHLARCDKRHFTLHDLNTPQDLPRQRRPVRSNGPTRRLRPVAVANAVDEETDEEEEEERNVVVKKEETAEDGEAKNEEDEEKMEVVEKEKEAEEEEQMTEDEEEEEAVDTVQVEEDEEKEEETVEDHEEKLDEEVEEEEELENDDSTIPALEENEEMMADEEQGAGVEAEEEDEHGPGGFHPVNIGDVFENRYHVVQPLGSGRYSTVWLCEEPQLMKPFAIKIVKSAEGFAQSARAEIKLLQCVQDADAADPHRDNIVRLIETFTITGVNGIHIAMILEALDCDLLKLLERPGHQGFAIEKVKTISRQVLQGLDYLHTKCNIIHTDIKPENILAKMANDEVTQVKIGDLGNSCRTHKLFMEEICTPEYRPPEVLVRIAYTTAADIWSAACMFFELATRDFLLYPEAGTRNDQAFTSDAEHLAMIKDMADLDPFPAKVFETGKRYNDYFNEEGELRHVTDKEPCSLHVRLLVMYYWDGDVARAFNDFLTPMLELDQATRATAAQCLQHRWLQPDGADHAPAAAAEQEESMEDRSVDDNQEPVPFHVNGNEE